MESNQVIDFESQTSHTFFNPRLSDADQKILGLLKLPDFKAHVWLNSSGTTQTTEMKLIALSKKAFLVAAAASNRHLEVVKEDVWYKNLPDFHVGGLSILARAHLSGSSVVDDYALGMKWDARAFVSRIEDVKATLISLVPTQVFDLVTAGLRSPSHVRAVLIGGAALSPDLFVKARELGWPLLPTYGMSEVCSQVATATLKSLSKTKFPDAIVLDHIEARTGLENIFELKSDALFTCLGFASAQGLRIEDPKIDGWYRTTDKVDLDISCDLAGRKTLRFLGRQSDLVKVNGELVSLAKLQARIDRQDAAVFARDDERAGSRICIATTSTEILEFEKYVDEFNSFSAPFERIVAMYYLDELPRTALGKLKLEALKNSLKS